MRNRNSCSLVFGLGLLAGCSGGQPSPGTAATPPLSISGTYVAYGHDATTDQVFIEALRITQSAPGQFTGTLESTDVNQAGQTKIGSKNVSGSFDGTHATIVLDEVIGHINRNATLAPGSITMTWMQQNGQLATERFVAKTDADYGVILDKLRGAAGGLAAQATAATNAKEADEQAANLVQRIQRFVAAEAKWNLT